MSRSPRRLHPSARARARTTATQTRTLSAYRVEVLFHPCIGVGAEQQLAGLAQPGGVAQHVLVDDERNLRSSPEEILELHDHLAPRGLGDLAAQVLGVLDDHLRVARVLSDLLEQVDRLR